MVSAPSSGHGRAARNVTISTRGLHWEDLDEDITIEGILAGSGDRSRARTKQGAPRDWAEYDDSNVALLSFAIVG